MGVFVFSVLFLIGLFPAIFFLDRLFAINFAKAGGRRPDSKDLFWSPRGFADTGAGEVEEVERRPLMEGVRWIFRAPDYLTEDLAAHRYLVFYRISVAVLAMIIFFGSLSFLIF